MVEEEALQGGLGSPDPDGLGAALLDEGTHLLEQGRVGVAQDDLGLVLDGDEVLQRALADDLPPEDDPDAVADLLDLLEQV